MSDSKQSDSEQSDSEQTDSRQTRSDKTRSAQTQAGQTPSSQPEPAAAPPHHTSRLQLIWDVVLFQFKLAADGLRDILLSPISILLGVLGLIAGGDDPHQYFRRLLRFGRRSEAWINLFGHHRRGTSDDLVDGLRQRVFTEVVGNPWLNRAGNRLNRTLDDVHHAARGPRSPGGDGSET